MAGNIKPTKCALRYDPPTLVLFYTDLSTGKKRQRSMPLRDFNGKVNISEYAAGLYSHSRHKDYFANIKKQQLESLLERVKKAQGKRSSLLSTSQTKKPFQDSFDKPLTYLGALPQLSKGGSTSKPFGGSLNIDDDLDRILNQTNDTEDLAVEEETMLVGKAKPTNNSDDELDQVFNSTDDDIEKLLQKEKGSKDKTKTIPASTNVKTTLPPLKSTLPPIQSISLTNNKPLAGKKESPFPSALDDVGAKKDLPQPKSPGENDDYSLSKEILSQVSEEFEESSDNDTPLMNSGHLKDLDQNFVTSDEEGEKKDEDFNELTETDYKKRKLEMEKEFEKKRVKPTDHGYIYDKEVEFGAPNMESGWDSSSSDMSEF